MGRTAHRAIDELLAADALYFGDVAPDAVYRGSELLWVNVLGEAVLWLDSQYSVANEQLAVNQGTGGAALDATYGSALGGYVADGATGENYVSLPGTVGNYLSVPDEAALDITGDIEMVAHVAPTDWTSGFASLIAKRSNLIDGQGSYELMLTDLNSLRIQWYDSGTVGFRSATSTTQPVVGDGEALWVKGTLDADNGAGGYTARFYTSSNGTTWTQLGSDVTAATVATIQVSTSSVEFGSFNSGGTILLNGKYYRAIIKDGIDGTTVLDVDLSAVPAWSDSFTATTGQTVTVNSTSPDTNDPLLLTHTGDAYAYLPGVSGNSLTIPSSAEDKTAFKDNWQIIGRFAPSASTGAEQDLFVMYQGFVVAVAAAGDTYRFYVGGSLANGVTAFTPDETRWWRFTRPVGNATIVIESAPDGPTKPVEEDWVEFETIASPTATTIDGVTDFYIGRSSGGVLPWKGKFYYFEAVDGAGTVRCKVDIPNDVTDGSVTSFTASSGQTVTVSRPASGSKLAMVTRPVWLFRTDDYLEVADNALLDFDETASFTVMAVLRRFNSTDGVVLSKRLHGDASATEGYAIRSGPTPTHDLYFPHGDGTTFRFPILQPGVDTLITAVGVHTPALSTLYAGGASDTSATAIAGTMSNAHPLRVGASVAGQYLNGEVIAVAVWDRALTTDEIAAINTYYGTV